MSAVTRRPSARADSIFLMSASSLSQFAGCRRTIDVANFVDAHRRRADEGRDVAGHAALNQIIEILAERRPVDLVFDIGLAFDHLLLHRLVERPHGFAFTHDFERHALANVALRTAILNERFGRPTQHVDEARRDGEAFGVNFGFAAGTRQLAYGRDAVAIDRDVADRRRVPAAVVDRAIPDNYLVVCAQ